MIEVQATRDKQDIPKLGALIGKANAGPWSISGVEFATGCLRFCGFESHCVGGHDYAGVLKFEVVTPDSDHANRCLFGDIMDIAQTKVYKKKKGAK